MTYTQVRGEASGSRRGAVRAAHVLRAPSDGDSRDAPSLRSAPRPCFSARST